MFPRRITIIALSVCLLAVCLLAACGGVNEMPAYRTRISAVHMASEVDSSPEIFFASPGAIDPSDPDRAAVEVVESRIRERLALRLDQLAHPRIVGEVFESSLRHSFSRRFPWTLVGPQDSYDTIFTIFIDDYGIDVDELGVATLYFDTEIDGRFVETGTLIYEERVRTDMPLTAIHQGHSPASDAAARALNLLSLDELSEADFQAVVLSGAERAADDLMRELFEDTYHE